ncbi:hypothetical protein JTB14_027255 [Gonioctena quinquepunctata]|nr:hypothetical protein JTB14_027255 [Gonioctena quinquepunctata]
MLDSRNPRHTETLNGLDQIDHRDLQVQTKQNGVRSSEAATGSRTTQKESLSELRRDGYRLGTLRLWIVDCGSSPDWLNVSHQQTSKIVHSFLCSHGSMGVHLHCIGGGDSPICKKCDAVDAQAHRLITFPLYANARAV